MIVVGIKWDGYLEEPYYSEKITLDLRKMENCLITTKDIEDLIERRRAKRYSGGKGT